MGKREWKIRKFEAYSRRGNIKVPQRMKKIIKLKKWRNFPKTEGMHFQIERTNQLPIIKFSHQCYYHEISEEKEISRNSWIMGVGKDTL